MYNFNFFEGAIMAFIANLRNLYESIGNNIPILVHNVGDEQYLRKINQIDNTKSDILYSKIPILSLSPTEDIQIKGDEISSPHTFGKLNKPNEHGFNTKFKNYAKRIPIEISINGLAKFDNYLDLLSFVEQSIMLLYRESKFYFTINGIDHYGNFQVQDFITYERNVNQGFDEETRIFQYPMQFIIKLNMPSYDLSDANLIKSTQTINKVIHNLDIDGEEETYNTPPDDE